MLVEVIRKCQLPGTGHDRNCHSKALQVLSGRSAFEPLNACVPRASPSSPHLAPTRDWRAMVAELADPEEMGEARSARCSP